MALRRQLKVRETELGNSLLPLVQGRLFHVTRRENVSPILSSGGISPNYDGALLTTFGSSNNSYFRNRGCVSVFDLFHPTPAEIERHLPDCWPFQHASPQSAIALFLLLPLVHERVISWREWRDQGAFSEMIVPYVEAGYPGILPIELVEEIIEVEVEEVAGSHQSVHRALNS